MRNRPWVKKFETGEYLRKWNGYEPYILGCTIYSQHIGIGEDKYFKCIGEFNGIGDVDWWIKEELDKLTQEEIIELKLICEYKTYLNNFITDDLINKISNFFECDTFHIYRIDHKNIIEFCNQINAFYNKILNNSEGCIDTKTVEFKEKNNPFKIVSFEEYKILKNK